MFSPPPTEEEANARALPFVLRIAGIISSHYPAHAGCVREELVGRKITEERWQRVAHAFSSLMLLPREALSQEERWLVDLAVDCASISRKMAAAKFGSKRPDECRQSAIWLIEDIEERITRHGDVR